MKVSATCLVLVLIFLSNTLLAQEVMTLEKAISTALENNFQIKIAEKNIEIAENNNTWGRAGKTPTVDLNGSWINSLINDNNPASFLQGTFYNSSLGPALDGNYLLYAGGRVRIAKAQLEIGLEQQKLLRSVEIADLIRAVHQSYYALLLQIQNETVIREVLGLSKRRLEYEEVKREFGSSNTFNLIQFQNALLSDSTNLVAQLNQSRLAEQNLYSVLDIMGMPNYAFPEKLETVAEDIDKEKLRALLEEENFTLRTLKITQELNQLNTRIEASTRKPSINLNASVGWNENYFKFFEDNPNTGEPFKGAFSNRLSGGLNVTGSWNIYDGGQNKANLRNAEIQEEISAVSFLEAKANLVNELNNLIGNYDNQKILLELTETQLRLAQENLTMTEERFKGGQITSLDYQNVQNQYLNAAFGRLNAIYNLILAKTDIDWLVGVFAAEEN